MKILIKEDFLKTIPDGKREAVINKLKSFTDLLIKEKKRIQDLPAGFWVRKMRGTKNIFKFRLNSGDRILFTYLSDAGVVRKGYQDSIIFLAFTNHDNQDLTSKNNSSFNIASLSINEQPYDDNEQIDEKITEKYPDFSLDLNNSITMVLDDKSLISLIDKNDEKYLYYLNDEQYSCLEITQAVLLSGSAGSGKTTVGMHKMLSTPADYNTAYFTYTKSLKDNSLEIYNKFSNREDHNNQFYIINDYLIRINNRSEKTFVNFERFNDWYLENKHRFLYVSSIDSVDLWAEIRGIIKGFMGVGWIRNRMLDRSKFDTESLVVLKECDFIKQNINGHIRWNPEKDCQKSVIKDLNKLEISRDTRDYIKSQIMNSRINSVFIDEESYLSLSADYSVFSKEERQSIYRFAHKYQEWLENQNYFDENDLALAELTRIQNNNTPKFDYIIIDEIQDLTELQIYAIIKSVKNPSGVFLSGDVHQIINPTYFSFGRIKNLYYVWGIKHEIKYLCKNYRSQGNIVELANILTKIRQNFIGRSDDYLETFTRNREKLFRLEPSEANLSAILNTVKDRHYVAIVVSSGDDKIKLEEKLKDSSPVIYTIDEIKGLEYPYIITYNLISNFSKAWDDIFKGLGRKNSKYRYYFNLFYVGITRARNNLLIYEDNINASLLHEIEPLLEFHELFDVHSLLLQKFSNPGEWLQEARRLEKKEKYEQAIKAYRKAVYMEGADTGIVRCEAKQLAQKGRYKHAGNLLMSQNILSLNNGDIDLLFEMVDKAEEPFLRLKAELWSGLFSLEEIEANLVKRKQSLRDVMDIKTMSGKDITLFMDQYFNPKLSLFDRRVDDANVLLDILKENN